MFDALHGMRCCKIHNRNRPAERRSIDFVDRAIFFLCDPFLARKNNGGNERDEVSGL